MKKKYQTPQTVQHPIAVTAKLLSGSIIINTAGDAIDADEAAAPLLDNIEDMALFGE